MVDNTLQIRKKYHYIQFIHIYSIDLVCFIIFRMFKWYFNKQYIATPEFEIMKVFSTVIKIP